MQTSRRFVLVSLTVATGAILVANAVVSYAARNSVPRQVMRLIRAGPPHVNVLAMGNSLMAAGFDTTTFAMQRSEGAQRTTIVNAALGASDIIAHLALTRLAWATHSRVDTLFYGYFDHQLWRTRPIRNADLIGNNAMLYYAEPELARTFGAMAPADRLQFEAFRSIPLLRERSAIWSLVEHLRRSAASLGMPVQVANAFGRRDDFTALEAADEAVFLSGTRAILDSAAAFTPAIAALFREANQHGTKVIVVEMPMSPGHQQRFYNNKAWQRLRMKTKQAIEAQGGCHIDASDWIPDDESFADVLHLTQAGARRFTARLSAALQADGSACHGDRQSRMP